MYNLWDVISNSFWILGLAVILAIWSYARYTAQVHRVRVKDKLNELKYAIAINVGLLLFLTGMALTENRTLVKILWILLGLGVLVDSGLRIQQHRKDKTK